MAPRKSTRSTTIQRSLLLNMSVLIVLVSGAILSITYVVRVRQAVEDAATARIRVATDALEIRLSQMFTSAADQLWVAKGWADGQLIDIEAPNQLDALFQPVLERNPFVAAVMITDDAGSGWELRRAETPPMRQDVDPHSQTWYVGAVATSASGEVYWTPPYTRSDGLPHMTASIKTDPGEDGTPEFVIAIDIGLLPISEYTSATYVSARGRLAVIDDDGELIGLPRGVDTSVPFMTPAHDLEIPEIATAVSRWMTDVRRRTRFFRFEAAGEHWWSAVRYFNVVANRRFALVAVVPESDFLHQAGVWRNAIILVTVGALGLAVLMATMLAHRYGRPLAGLARASRRMRLEAERNDAGRAPAAGPGSSTELASGFDIGLSRIREIDALAEDFENMAAKVASKSRQLEEYSRTLEEKVKARTEDLNAKNIELMELLAELHETQQQLVLQEKMASLGNLVAGVAHEINNPIGAVGGAASVSSLCIDKLSSMLKEGVDPKSDSEFDKLMETLVANNKVVIEGTGRVAEIVKSLKRFSRLDEAEEQRADIHECIESTLTLADHLLKGRIEVVKEFGDIPEVMCYPGQLNQVFMNILANAAQAIEGDGRIVIETRADEERIYIDISDTGKGMAPDVIERIFDPGFTTKGVGVGTGLGLSISHRIIEKHGGTLQATSAPGAGTTMHIQIPVNGANG